jgi:L-ascorbate metabolism protein UlaG (beta-lactamase superfamily)
MVKKVIIGDKLRNERPEAMEMKLKWFGHSSFYLTSKSGVRVLMDPFKSDIGLDMPLVEADIVTMSHNHRDHNNKEAVSGTFKVINKPGKFEKGGVDILGVPTAHDDVGGAKRGKNIVFKVTMDGTSVCHCGDLGHILTPGQIKEVGHVDVLLVPVGGYYTIDAKAAADVVRQIDPGVTIPMHYKLEGLTYPIEGVEPFIEAAGGAKKLDTNEIDLDGGLKGYSGVLVLGR